MASPAASISKPHGPPAGSRVTPWPATRPGRRLGNQGRAETHEHQFVSASQPRETGLDQALHPLPARNEWGEDRGEGKPIKTHLLSPPSPPSDGGVGEIEEIDAALRARRWRKRRWNCRRDSATRAAR